MMETPRGDNVGDLDPLRPVHDVEFERFACFVLTQDLLHAAGGQTMCFGDIFLRCSPLNRSDNLRVPVWVCAFGDHFHLKSFLRDEP